MIDYINNYKGQPLLLLGAGESSKGIIKHLNECGIKDFQVCVDDERWHNDMVAQGGYSVKKINSILGNAEKTYDIIVAYSFFDKASEESLRDKFSDKINRIEFHDIFPHFWMEPQIYHVTRDRLSPKLCKPPGRCKIEAPERRFSNGKKRHTDTTTETGRPGKAAGMDAGTGDRIKDV